MCDGVKELMYIRNLLKFLEIELKGPIEVFNDNQGALKIGNDLTSVSRTRHIEMKYYFVQKHVEKKRISLKYLRTDEMIANIMTKPLGNVKFDSLRKRMVN
jgi:hypothetical protein